MSHEFRGPSKHLKDQKHRDLIHPELWCLFPGLNSEDQFCDTAVFEVLEADVKKTAQK